MAGSFLAATRFLYMAEAGDRETLRLAESTTPLCYIQCGVVLPAKELHKASVGLIAAKRKHFPGYFRGLSDDQWLDPILNTRMQGDEIRGGWKQPDRGFVRAKTFYVQSLLSLLRDCRAVLLARVHVKTVGESIPHEDLHVHVPRPDGGLR